MTASTKAAAMAIAISIALMHGATAAGKEFVEGIGWLPTTVVSACLQAAGEEDTDALHDASWEEFLACVGDHKR